MLSRLIAVPWYGLTALTGIAAAQSPAPTYDSPYAAYQPYRDEPLASWRKANDALATAANQSAQPAAGTHHGSGAGSRPDASRGSAPPAKAPAPAHGHH